MGININVPNQINQNTPLRPVRSGATAEPDYSVKYTPQELTEAQQAQARQNIGAAAAGEGGGGATINEFVYTRTGEPGAYTGVISCTGYEPKEGDLMTISFQGPFYTDYNPVTLNNGTTNPTVTLLNAEVNATDYDEINPEVNTKWTVRLTKVNDAWVAVNISTQVQADWNTSDTTMPSYIKNKPSMPSLPTANNPIMMDNQTLKLFFSHKNSASLSAKYDWFWSGNSYQTSSNPTSKESIDIQFAALAVLHLSDGSYNAIELNIRDDNDVWCWASENQQGIGYYNRINLSSNGTFNIVYEGSADYETCFNRNNVNHPEHCWAWFMTNEMKGENGDSAGNIVLADASMANLKVYSDPSSISSLIGIDIYVPKSRLTEFEIRMKTIHGIENYESYVEPKVHTYDFIVQSGLTLKMITLPTLPLTMTDANNNTISGDFVAQNITITPGV